MPPLQDHDGAARELRRQITADDAVWLLEHLPQHWPDDRTRAKAVEIRCVLEKIINPPAPDDDYDVRSGRELAELDAIAADGEFVAVRLPDIFGAFS